MANRRRIAGYKDVLTGAGRSDVLPLGEPRDARRVEGAGRLITSRGGLAVSGLTGEAVTPGQELGEADTKLPG